MMTLKNRAATAVFCAAWTLMVPAYGDQFSTQTKAVVELFTSQGCAQCPSADALLAELGRDPSIVTLAYHVDYWDFMGWTDSFGSRDNSNYQRGYARNWGAPRIFTPQMIINGNQSVIGSRGEEVSNAVSSAQLGLSLKLEKTGDTLQVLIPANDNLQDASVWAVSYIPSTITSIDSGENEGKRLPYTHIVTSRELLGTWSAKDGAEFLLSLEDVAPNGGGVAVLVQKDDNNLPGTILAAAAYEH